MKHKESVYKIVIPGLIGNILEWYDFALYGYFSSTLATLFFPLNNPMVSRIATFSVFALGFLMRPLGAIFFGYYGDKFGRKNALASAIILMAVPTTLIGILPSVHSIGLWATFLLILFRLLQGFAVGGEFTGSIVYIVEHAPNSKRGFFGSLAMSSAFVGLLLGSLVALIVHRYFSLVDYAWRVPFLCSLFLGFIGLYLRLGMPESPVYQRYHKNRKQFKSPIKDLIQTRKILLLKAIMMVMLPSGAFYLSFVYLPTYLKYHVHIKLAQAMLANTTTMLGIIFFIPVIGKLSDHYGRKPFLLLGALGFFLLSLPMYFLLQSASLLNIYLAMVVFALLVACSYAVVPAVLVEMFPTRIRYTGMSLPYNISNAVFGGTAPLVATALIYQTGDLFSPSYYLMILACLTGIMTFSLKETYLDPL